jgi:hypothetical protein
MQKYKSRKSSKEINSKWVKIRVSTLLFACQISLSVLRPSREKTKAIHLLPTMLLQRTKHKLHITNSSAQHFALHLACTKGSKYKRCIVFTLRTNRLPMISSIAWVPAGVADPNPKRYEMSSTEQELIRMMQEKVSIDAGEKQNSKGMMAVKKAQAPIVHTLPADLRMDDYSSDEDEGVALGNLLADKTLPIPDEMVPEDEEEEESEDEDEDEDQEEDMKDGKTDAPNDGDIVSDGESDDDDFDDLDDVPDTREFDPVDVEGLEAMGLSHVSTANGAMYMDDLDGGESENSETDDVRLTSNDAVVVVAKTEEVSSCVGVAWPVTTEYDIALWTYFSRYLFSLGLCHFGGSCI